MKRGDVSRANINQGHGRGLFDYDWGEDEHEVERELRFADERGEQPKLRPIEVTR